MTVLPDRALPDDGHHREGRTVSACRTGVSMWCETGRHGNCAHRLGGPQEDGVWFPECCVTAPVGHGGKHVVLPAAWPNQSYAMVVRPSHLWRCGCDCHQAGQIPLFGMAVSE